jgi:predicted N-acetyltransferase YhbS
VTLQKLGMLRERIRARIVIDENRRTTALKRRASECRNRETPDQGREKVDGFASARIGPMPEIRPFAPADAHAVASLYERVSRSGAATPHPLLQRYFEQTFFDSPWSDPELPSLVYEDSTGHVVGFIGLHGRNVEFEKRRLRLAAVGPLLVAPDARGGAAGFELVKVLFRGPQDLAYTGSANVIGRRIWEALGARPVPLNCMTWTYVLRPATLTVSRLVRKGPRSLGLSLPLGRAVDAATHRFVRARQAHSADVSTEPLTTTAMLDLWPTTANAFRLRPDYDDAYLTWRLEGLREWSPLGAFIHRLVRVRGRTVGWYMYYARRDAISEVLQVSAEPRHVRATLDELFRDALVHGSAAVRGRLEAHLYAPLTARRCIFRPGEGTLVRGLDPEPVRAILAGEALLTRFDDEWSFTPHLL